MQQIHLLFYVFPESHGHFQHKVSRLHQGYIWGQFVLGCGVCSLCIEGYLAVVLASIPEMLVILPPMCDNQMSLDTAQNS